MPLLSGGLDKVVMEGQFLQAAEKCSQLSPLELISVINLSDKSLLAAVDD
ncbi:MAG: hypothetical protein RBG13Loki_1512 [Promethearchaeota archaeon CR_4]|nr:MAG: hypothetical protein RBG13Loki_1512 [Candidatus Lokiarchaeota archaeon CR_4]